MRRIKKLFFRCLAFNLAITLTGMGIMPLPASAQVMPLPIQSQLPKDLSQFRLPLSLGKIDDLKIGKDGRVVILIQDAHAIPDAQGSIQKIIAYLQEVYGVQHVAVEGTANRLDPTLFKSFPDKVVLKKLFKEYFDRGELTGTSAAALFNSGREIYEGVEDWDVYEQGLALYLSALDKQPGLLEYLKSQKENLESEKLKIYSKKLSKVDALIHQFLMDQSDLLSTLKGLAEFEAPPVGSDLALMLEEAKHEGGDQSGIEIEVKKAAEKIHAISLTTQITGGEQKLFNQKYQEFKTGQMTPQAFSAFLKKFSARNGLKVSFSKALQFSANKQVRLEQVEGTKFFRDFKVYAKGIKAKLFENEAQRSLDRESDQAGLLERLALMKLDQEDWQIVSSGTLSVENTAFRDALLPAVAFYQNAKKRDEILFRNLMKQMDKAKTNAGILVAGGFHTEGLARHFIKSGSGFVVIMPGIRDLPAESRYVDQMRGDVSWRKELKVENGKIDLYGAFARYTRDRLLKLEEGNSSSSNFELRTSNPMLLKNWRDQILRDLAAEGRLEQAAQYTRFLDEVVGSKDEGEDLKTVWLKSAEKFIGQIKDLKSTNQLNQASVAKLFAPSGMAAAQIAGQVAPGASLPAAPHSAPVDLAAAAALLSGADAAQAPRSEVRSLSGDSELLMRNEQLITEDIAEAYEVLDKTFFKDLADLKKKASDKSGFVLDKPRNSRDAVLAELFQKLNLVIQRQTGIHLTLKSLSKMEEGGLLISYRAEGNSKRVYEVPLILPSGEGGLKRVTLSFAMKRPKPDVKITYQEVEKGLMVDRRTSYDGKVTPVTIAAYVSPEDPDQVTAIIQDFLPGETVFKAIQNQLTPNYLTIAEIRNIAKTWTTAGILSTPDGDYAEFPTDLNPGNIMFVKTERTIGDEDPAFNVVDFGKPDGEKNEPHLYILGLVNQYVRGSYNTQKTPVGYNSQLEKSDTLFASNETKALAALLEGVGRRAFSSDPAQGILFLMKAVRGGAEKSYWKNNSGLYQAILTEIQEMMLGFEDGKNHEGWQRVVSNEAENFIGFFMPEFSEFYEHIKRANAESEAQGQQQADGVKRSEVRTEPGNLDQMSIPELKDIAKASLSIAQVLHDRDIPLLFTSGTGTMAESLFKNAWKRLYPNERLPVMLHFGTVGNIILYKNYAGALARGGQEVEFTNEEQVFEQIRGLFGRAFAGSSTERERADLLQAPFTQAEKDRLGVQSLEEFMEKIQSKKLAMAYLDEFSLTFFKYNTFMYNLLHAGLDFTYAVLLAPRIEGLGNNGVTGHADFGLAVSFSQFNGTFSDQLTNPEDRIAEQTQRVFIHMVSDFMDEAIQQGFAPALIGSDEEHNKELLEGASALSLAASAEELRNDPRFMAAIRRGVIPSLMKFDILGTAKQDGKKIILPRVLFENTPLVLRVELETSPHIVNKYEISLARHSALKRQFDRLLRSEVRIKEGMVEFFLKQKLEEIARKNSAFNLAFKSEDFQGEGTPMPEGLTTEQLEGLYAIAVKHHEGQTRKDAAKTNYMAHVLGVVSILVNRLSVSDPQTIAAAFLHDALEDSIEYFEKGDRSKEKRTALRDAIQTSIEQDLENLGLKNDVVGIMRKVNAMTKREGVDLIGEYFPGLLKVPFGAELKVADRLYNLSDLKHSDKTDFAYNYILGEETGTLHEFVEALMPSSGKGFIFSLEPIVQLTFKRQILQALLDNYNKGGDNKVKIEFNDNSALVQQVIQRVDSDIPATDSALPEVLLQKAIEFINSEISRLPAARSEVRSSQLDRGQAVFPMTNFPGFSEEEARDAVYKVSKAILSLSTDEPVRISLDKIRNHILNEYQNSPSRDKVAAVFTTKKILSLIKGMRFRLKGVSLNRSRDHMGKDFVTIQKQSLKNVRLTVDEFIDKNNGAPVVFIGGPSNLVDDYSAAIPLIQSLLARIKASNPDSVIVVGTSGFGHAHLIVQEARRLGLKVFSAIPGNEMVWAGDADGYITAGTDWNNNDYYEAVGRFSTAIFTIDGNRATGLEYAAVGKNPESKDKAYSLDSTNTPSPELLDAAVQISLSTDKSFEPLQSETLRTLNLLSQKTGSADLPALERQVRRAFAQYENLKALRDAQQALLNGINAAHSDVVEKAQAAGINEFSLAAVIAALSSVSNLNLLKAETPENAREQVVFELMRAIHLSRRLDYPPAFGFNANLTSQVFDTGPNGIKLEDIRNKAAEVQTILLFLNKNPIAMFPGLNEALGVAFDEKRLGDLLTQLKDSSEKLNQVIEDNRISAKNLKLKEMPKAANEFSHFLKKDGVVSAVNQIGEDRLQAAHDIYQMLKSLRDANTAAMIVFKNDNPEIMQKLINAMHEAWLRDELDPRNPEERPYDAVEYSALLHNLIMGQVEKGRVTIDNGKTFLTPDQFQNPELKYKLRLENFFFGEGAGADRVSKDFFAQFKTLTGRDFERNAKPVQVNTIAARRDVLLNISVNPDKRREWLNRLQEASVHAVVGALSNPGTIQRLQSTVAEDRESAVVSLASAISYNFRLFNPDYGANNYLTSKSISSATLDEGVLENLRRDVGSAMSVLTIFHEESGVKLPPGLKETIDLAYQNGLGETLTLLNEGGQPLKSAVEKSSESRDFIGEALKATTETDGARSEVRTAYKEDFYIESMVEQILNPAENDAGYLKSTDSKKVRAALAEIIGIDFMDAEAEVAGAVVDGVGMEKYLTALSKKQQEGLDQKFSGVSKRLVYEGLEKAGLLLRAKVYRVGKAKMPILSLPVYDTENEKRKAKGSQFEPLSDNELQQRGMIPVRDKTGEAYEVFVFPHQNRNGFVPLRTVEGRDGRVYFGESSKQPFGRVLSGTPESYAYEFKGIGAKAYVQHIQLRENLSEVEVRAELLNLMEEDPEIKLSPQDFVEANILKLKSAKRLKSKGWYLSYDASANVYKVFKSQRYSELLKKRTPGKFIGLRYQRVSTVYIGGLHDGDESKAQRNERILRKNGAALGVSIKQVSGSGHAILGFAHRRRFGSGVRMSAIDKNTEIRPRLWAEISRQNKTNVSNLPSVWLPGFLENLGKNIHALFVSNLVLHESQGVGKDYDINGFIYDTDFDELLTKNDRSKSISDQLNIANRRRMNQLKQKVYFLNSLVQSLKDVSGRINPNDFLIVSNHILFGDNQFNLTNFGEMKAQVNAGVREALGDEKGRLLLEFRDILQKIFSAGEPVHYGLENSKLDTEYARLIDLLRKVNPEADQALGLTPAAAESGLDAYSVPDIAAIGRSEVRSPGKKTGSGSTVKFDVDAMYESLESLFSTPKMPLAEVLDQLKKILPDEAVVDLNEQYFYANRRYIPKANRFFAMAAEYFKAREAGGQRLVRMLDFNPVSAGVEKVNIVNSNTPDAIKNKHYQELTLAERDELFKGWMNDWENSQSLFHVDHHYDYPVLATVSTTVLLLDLFLYLHGKGREDLLGKIQNESFGIMDHSDADILLAQFVVGRAMDKKFLEDNRDLLANTVLFNDYILIPEDGKAEARALILFNIVASLERQIADGQTAYSTALAQIPNAISFAAKFSQEFSEKELYEGLTESEDLDGRLSSSEQDFARLFLSEAKQYWANDRQTIESILAGGVEEIAMGNTESLKPGGVYKIGPILFFFGEEGSEAELSSSSIFRYLRSERPEMMNEDIAAIAVSSAQGQDETNSPLRNFKIRTFMDAEGHFLNLSKDFWEGLGPEGFPEAGGRGLAGGLSKSPIPNLNVSKAVSSVVSAVNRAQERQRLYSIGGILNSILQHGILSTDEGRRRGLPGFLRGRDKQVTDITPKALAMFVEILGREAVDPYAGHPEAPEGKYYRDDADFEEMLLIRVRNLLDGSDKTRSPRMILAEREHTELNEEIEAVSRAVVEERLKSGIMILMRSSESVSDWQSKSPEVEAPGSVFGFDVFEPELIQAIFVPRQIYDALKTLGFENSKFVPVDGTQHDDTYDVDLPDWETSMTQFISAQISASSERYTYILHGARLPAASDRAAKSEVRNAPQTQNFLEKMQTPNLSQHEIARISLMILLKISRGSLPEQVGSPATAAQAMLDLLESYGDDQEALAKIESQIVIFIDTVTDPSVSQKTSEAAAKALIDSLKQIRGDQSLTIGAILPSVEMTTEFLAAFLKTVKARSSVIGEVVIAGKGAPLSGFKAALQGIVEMARQVAPNREILLLNDQGKVPMVFGADENVIRSIYQQLHESFYPVSASSSTVEDPFTRNYIEVLKVVAAIHTADLLSHDPKLLTNSEELKQKLFERLFLVEDQFTNMLKVSGKGIGIDATVARVYLAWKAAQAAAEAA